MKPQSLLLIFVYFVCYPFVLSAKTYGPTRPQNRIGHADQIERYWQATLHSMDCMRAPSGLITDSAFVEEGRAGGAVDSFSPGPEKAAMTTAVALAPYASSCPLRFANTQTSPTNIAMDLFLLMEVERWATIDQVLGTIEALPFHASTGLFFNRYDIFNPQVVTDHYVSSVDNVHLHLALWVLAELKVQTFALSARARALLDRINWTELIDPLTGLARGGLAYDGKSFIPAPWYFSHAGSEARSIYSLGFALGFASGPIPQSPALTWEFHHESGIGPMMRTWDGGVFQMLLPEVLIHESAYSSSLFNQFTNFSKWALARSKGDPLPALFSACQLGPFSLAELLRNDCGQGNPCYLGGAGHRPLISHLNDDRHSAEHSELRERASTLHAVFLAALFDRDAYLKRLQNAEQLSSGGYPLFHDQLGWMDSYHLKGPNRHQVVPMILSLDQGMVGLSLARWRSGDNENVVSRTLKNNITVAKRLHQIYLQWQNRW